MILAIEFDDNIHCLQHNQDEICSDVIMMNAVDTKFHDSPRKTISKISILNLIYLARSISFITDNFLIFSNDGREPLKYLFFNGPNMKKIEKAKTVHYDFASFSQKNNVFIGYKNASITLC